MVRDRGADLHTHTNASDGVLTPTELVEAAAKSDILALGITDHDTMQGIEEALEVAERIGFAVIPGVELSTYWESPVLGPQTVHLLAYAPNPNSDLLSKHMADAKYDREHRAESIVRKLNELGLAIEWLRVREIAGDAQIGRPHIARAILERGYETDWNRIFDRWIGNDAPAYVSGSKLDTLDAVNMVVAAGGLPVVAHPYYDFHGGTLDLENLLPPLVHAGLKGLEVYYGGIDRQNTVKYEVIAAEHGLLATGGSDFHGGDLSNDITIGCAVCPRETLLQICEMTGTDPSQI